MRPVNVFSISSASDCDGHFGSEKASLSRAKPTLYASTPSSRRLVACVQNVLAFSQASRLLRLYVLSKFWLGTWQRKNTSFGFDPSASRNFWILALGRNRMARSSSMRCSASRFDPLIGTVTKQSSEDQ